MLTDHDIYEWGEPIRHRLGITGGPEQAKRTPHPHTPRQAGGLFCVLCGLAEHAGIHRIRTRR